MPRVPKHIKIQMRKEGKKMKEYTTPKIDLLTVDADILTFSVGQLESLDDGSGTPIRDLVGGNWGW